MPITPNSEDAQPKHQYQVRETSCRGLLCAMLQISWTDSLELWQPATVMKNLSFQGQSVHEISKKRGAVRGGSDDPSSCTPDPKYVINRDKGSVVAE